MLTLDRKQRREHFSIECLLLYQWNPSEFWHRFITVDETWVSITIYTSESKEQSERWALRGEAAPKKKSVSSANKIMATVFWDAHGIILIDYLKKEKKTMNGEYYGNLL